MPSETSSPPHHGLKKILRLWQTILESVAIVFLCGSVSCIFLQTALRNLANFGHAGFDEVARMLFIWMAYFTIPVLSCEHAHIQIDMFTKRFKGWAGLLVQLFSLAACIVFSLTFLYSEYAFMQKGWDVKTPALGLPNLLFFAGPIIGMASLLIFTVEKFITLMLTRKGDA